MLGCILIPSFPLSLPTTFSKANVFVIGKGSESWISLPKGKGIYVHAVEARERNLKKAAKAAAH